MKRPKHPLLRRGLEYLNGLPQIKAIAIEEPFASERLIADGKVTLHSPQGEIEYVVEVKSNVSLETYDDVLKQLEIYRQRLEPGQRNLLVGDDFSQSVIKKLIDSGIEFIDASGAVYLSNPSLYVLIRKDGAKPQPASNIKIGSTHLKIIYVILQQPEILEKAPGKITQLAGFKREGHVLRRVRELCSLNYLDRLPNQKFRVSDYVGLLERWEIGYAESLRNHLLVGQFRPPKNLGLADFFDKVVDQANHLGLLIGGELGAGLATQYLKGIKAILHLPQEVNYRTVAAQLRLMPDPQGSITFLNQFGTSNAWDNNRFSYIADPLLLHAELSLETDERLKETAQRIFDDFIAERIPSLNREL
ncbi:type IV toxin-antitoxin system AbiEi family antitoxin [Nodosilinea sp. P-1105]|uniref:type IV toxin-antitoxin system AbiEi family antitoxin n=1 Tax=Nodosilinea sp. P-1105 TaxID=2546229 RepID=UPI00146C6297|nr:type IV toxin-antitoxin system AbiEi family antitoxin [Nodosilinea sp. P-1105]NMF85750.1 hypothetical protein [Nodosilinea sp. P-1105]